MQCIRGCASDELWHVPRAGVEEGQSQAVEQRLVASRELIAARLHHFAGEQNGVADEHGPQVADAPHDSRNDLAQQGAVEHLRVERGESAKKSDRIELHVPRRGKVCLGQCGNDHS